MMSVCVNLNSKEFKDCCKRFDVTAASLEPIIHEYINTEGNENSFPSDFYISERLEGAQTVVTSKEQLQLWEEKYSNSKEFSSLEEATEYYNKVLQFFDKEAIGFKETSDGKYVIRVVKPIYDNITNLEAKLINQIEGEEHKLEQFDIRTPDNKENTTVYYNRDIRSWYWKLHKYVTEHINDKGFSLKHFNEQYGTNFGFNPRTKEITTKDERLHGVSIWNPHDTEVIAKKRIDRAVLLEYLTSKFGLKLQEISVKEYDTRFGNMSNCCVVGDTVYVRKGDLKTLTDEQLIEEFLHPVIHAIYESNSDVAKSLLEEARKLFPDLVKQIEVAYRKQGQQVIEEEIITQVLSKYLKKEISDKGPNNRTIITYIKQFLEEIFEFCKDLFGEISIDYSTEFKISGKDINEVLSFENLAELINSKEITFTDTLSLLTTSDLTKNSVNSIAFIIIYFLFLNCGIFP